MLAVGEGELGTYCACSRCRRRWGHAVLGDGVKRCFVIGVGEVGSYCACSIGVFVEWGCIGGGGGGGGRKLKNAVLAVAV